ncbi:major type 1 subunit fimbrin (pilin) [Pseudomonas sp. IT-P258]|uniref:fimbrial protein n=1 Tax=Pseudomonas sp. IT-P258 TaxID=3026447 RepID=UPI0039E07185
MKTSLFALPLALGMGLAATSAFAADGRINFTGNINSATCPIEIVNPDSGNVSNLVSLGWVDSTDFKGINTVAGERAFQMRVTPGSACVLDPAKLDATITFNSVYGGGGNHYGLKPTGTPAKGVAVAIKDASGSFIENGDTSVIYQLDETNPTLMDFTAMYIATAATVIPGPADSDVEFTLHIN